MAFVDQMKKIAGGSQEISTDIDATVVESCMISIIVPINQNAVTTLTNFEVIVRQNVITKTIVSVCHGLVKLNRRVSVLKLITRELMPFVPVGDIFDQNADCACT